MTLKKLKKEPFFFSLLPAFAEFFTEGKDAFGDFGSSLSSTGNLPLVGLTESEGSLGRDGLVEVEKRGVVGAVEGVVRERVEVETVLSESLLSGVFIELDR